MTTNGATTAGRIEIVSLTKRFGDVAAVDDISLDIPGGEFFSMVGPSGCGKTTTLRMIAGFERPDAGEIRLDGVDMSATPPHKRNVNTVFQSYALFPHLTRRRERGVRAALPEGDQGRADAGASPRRSRSCS